MNAEIIATGHELIQGGTVDTNSAFIARTLAGLGISVQRITLIGDDTAQFVDCLRQSASRVNLILTTGGLGPTIDDKTRPAVAEAFHRELETRPELAESVRDWFVRFRRPMPENNLRQAQVPSGALAFPNAVGTAPIFIVEEGAVSVVCLPGVPREMTYNLESVVVPYLRQRFDLRDVILTRVLHVAGLGESDIDQQVGDLEALENPIVGLSAHAGVVHIRITARAESSAAAQALIAPVEAAARARLGKNVFGADAETLASCVVQALQARQSRLQVVELGTGGAIGQQLTLNPQASAVLAGIALQPPAEDVADLLDLAESLAVKAAQDCVGWGLVGALRLTPQENGAAFAEIAIAIADENGVCWRMARSLSGVGSFAGEWLSNTALFQLFQKLTLKPSDIGHE
ncbi:MAG TPA: molybdopterin-binding protein [Anaerolineales bacterium]|nr:molybdopterin-binding protein [Anaerolineales bacterium]